MPEIDNLKSELKLLAGGFVALIIILYVAFRQSSLGHVFQTAFAIYWMFVLPGYALSLWINLGLVERFIIGVGVQTAVFGLVSYYAGLAGWHVATHGIVLPLLSMAVGVLIWWKRK